MKKIITVLTSVAMLLVGTTVANAETYYLGDVNKDGIVDAIDASAILTYYAVTSVGGSATIDEALADFDKNGRVDAIDASCVLTLYAKAATVGNVSYELVEIADEGNVDAKIIPSKSDEIGFGSVLRFNKDSWTIHSRATINLDSDIYEKHQYLHTGDTIVVLNSFGDGWYKISFPEDIRHPEPMFVYISTTALNNGVFEKIGENAFIANYIEGNNTATTTTTTLTSTTTTTTTSTTTSTVTNTTIESTNSVIAAKSDEIGFGSVLRFNKDSWTVHSRATSNLDADIYEKHQYLHTGDTIVVFNNFGDGWYKIGFPEDVTHLEPMFVYISTTAFNNGVFEKIGENAFLTNYIESNNTATANTTSSASTTTTTTAAETTSTTLETTSTTEPVSTSQETTTTAPTVIEPMPRQYYRSYFKFVAKSWYIHTAITNDPKGDIYSEKEFLTTGDLFLIKKIYTGGWYEIKLAFSNTEDTNLFIHMSDEDFEKYCVNLGSIVYE